MCTCIAAAGTRQGDVDGNSSRDVGPRRLAADRACVASRRVGHRDVCSLGVLGPFSLPSF